MVEQFVRALTAVPFCRERSSALLTRSAFSERAQRLRLTLDAMLDAVSTVRTSAESETGVLRGLLTHALSLIVHLNGDGGAKGLRLASLAKLERYVSADKRVNLLQYLARRLLGAEDQLSELATLEDVLGRACRLVWAEAAVEVDALRETLAALRRLTEQVRSELQRPDGHGLDDNAAASLASFAEGIESFCTSTAAPAVEQLAKVHGHADESCRSLQRWLAVAEPSHARPEETFSDLHTFVTAIRVAHRYYKLANERERAARLRALTTGASGAGGLVDAVDSRFHSCSLPAVEKQVSAEHSSDRSAELLRLLLRRASIAGTSLRAVATGVSDEEGEESESDNGFSDDEAEGE